MRNARNPAPIYKITLLNKSILTDFGKYLYTEVKRHEAMEILRGAVRDGIPIESAIGCKATAKILTVLLDYPVEVNLIEFKQTQRDVALVFKLTQLPPEGKTLTFEEIQAIGYEFGLLIKEGGDGGL